MSLLANFHTHSTFCDGENTPEESVLAAIESGFSSLGFSGHGYTPYDLRYCMKDVPGYCAEIRRLQKKYADRLQIYLGVEEDSYAPLDRKAFDYIIGSSHYFCLDGSYYPVDSGLSYLQQCLTLVDGDPVRLAQAYYAPFCRYIAARKPDVVGHFDLITKFDEQNNDLLLSNAAYLDMADTYMYKAAQNEVLFEVNTGAISRGYRHDPYPHERLLHVLKKCRRGVVLSSDSHAADTLAFGFDEAKRLLRAVGFDSVYVLYDHQWKKECI